MAGSHRRDASWWMAIPLAIREPSHLTEKHGEMRVPWRSDQSVRGLVPTRDATHAHLACRPSALLAASSDAYEFLSPRQFRLWILQSAAKMPEKRKRGVHDATDEAGKTRKKQKQGFKVGPDNLPDGTYRRKSMFNICSSQPIID